MKYTIYLLVAAVAGIALLHAETGYKAIGRYSIGDRTRGPNGAIYVVAMSKNSAGSYFQRLNAFDITSGAQLFGGPHTITATYPGTGDNSSGGNVILIPRNTKNAPDY